MFAVLRLQKTVTVNLDGNKFPVKVDGIAGYIPVFDTYDEAVENSDCFKYQIIEVEAS